VHARTFVFARAGHNPLILKRSPHHETEFVQPAGMAIGLKSGPMFDENIEEVSIPLHTGDVLVLYTDGFTEAMNARRQQYGDARLAEKVQGASRHTAGEILRTVSEDVHHFLEAVGRHDDMTMMVVKVEHLVQRQTVHREPAAAREHIEASL
jgi:phosphoserine phosphatase RsbU/P